MKSILLAIGLLCYVNIGFANTPVRTVIVGHISKGNSIDTTRVTVSVYDAVILDYRQMPEYVKTSVNGYFKFELFIDHPVHTGIRARGSDMCDRSYTFTFVPNYPIDGEYGFLIEPGDSINVGFLDTHYSNLTNINFSGRGSEKLLCVQSILKCASFYEFPGFHLNKPTLKDSVIKMINDNLNIFKHKISPVAFSIIKSQYVCLLATNASGKDVAMMNRNIGFVRMPKNFFGLDLKDSSLIFAWPFLNKLLRQAAWALWSKEKRIPFPTEADEGPFEEELFDALLKYIPDCPLKQQILAKYVFHKLVKHGIDQELLNKILSILDQEKQGGKYIPQISDTNRKMNDLRKGTPAYSFCLNDTNNNRLCMSELKGKIVVLDFMFNGCSGCAELVPHLAKVENAFTKNNDVIFVSISIDKDPISLKKAIGKFCIQGSVALYTNGEKENHPIIKFYQIDAYPKVVVVDKNGNIITAQAPDPRFEGGEAKLIELIKSSL